MIRYEFLKLATIACLASLAACTSGSGAASSSSGSSSSSSGGSSSSGSSSSSGGSGSSSSSGAITSGLDSFTLCGTSIADSTTACPSSPPSSDSDTSGFWNQVEVYYSSNATRAVVFLHGGGGTNYGMAYDLGLNANDAAPTSTADIDFQWLSANNVIAVFPQGQSKGLGSGGTWTNWVMDSGQDDEAFLQALAAYVKTSYGVGTVYLVGHSNGGMMANRMWCESPATFAAYVALAGPASQHYLTAGNSCAPSAVMPYFGIVGAQDTVICDTDASTSTGLTNPNSGCASGASWTSAIWSINQTYVDTLGSGSFVNPALINESQQQLTRAGLLCGETSLSPDPADSNSLNTVWSNCGGELKLDQVLDANHPLSYGHGLCGLGDSCSIEVASGNGKAGSTGLLDLIVGFLDSLGG